MNDKNINRQQELLAIGDKYGLRPDRIRDIATSYEVAANVIAAEYDRAMAIRVENADEDALMLQAGKLRLHLAKFRTELENTRIDLGKDALREKQAIDKMAKFIRDSFEVAEAHLKEQETFKERLEAKRLDELAAERTEILAALDFPLAGVNVRELTDDEFKFLRERAENAFEAEKARKAEEKAKFERLEREAHESRERELEAQKELLAEREKTERLEREQREANRKAQIEEVEAKRRKWALKHAPDAGKLRSIAWHLHPLIEQFEGIECESSMARDAFATALDHVHKGMEALELAIKRLETDAKLAAEIEKKAEGNCPECGFEATDGECTNEHCPEPF